MWLITAVGGVNGQSKFTFALEQSKTYVLGRGKECNIRFDSRHIRPTEGSIIVGAWDPTDPKKPPELRWKLEPKKNGTYGSCRTIFPQNDEDIGSTDREDYEATEVDMADGSQGCFLEHPGQGVELTEGVWFFSQWKDSDLQYDKMKDTPDEQRDTLKQYCIPWTASFDVDHPPSLVVAASYKNSVDCNLAVCYGIRILLPVYINALVGRLNACWRRTADSQDSFTLPNPENADLQPSLDKGLPNLRSDVTSWLPNAGRRELWKGWTIMGLRGKTASTEKRYLLAMGAEYTDIDLVSRPVKSPDDLEERMSSWLAEINRRPSKDQVLVVYFARTKDEASKAGVDWAGTVVQLCRKQNLILASGAVCWGSVRYGGVTEYIEALSATAGPRPTATTVTAGSTSGDGLPGPAASAQPEVEAAEKVGQVRDQQGPPTGDSTFVPSTFPDETDGKREQRAGGADGSRRSPEKGRRVSPVKRTGEEISGGQDPARRPLKRRAGKTSQATQDDMFSTAFDMADDPPIPSRAAAVIQQPSQQTPPDSQVSKVPETQFSVPPVPTQSRLRRRAGQQQQQHFDFGMDLTMDQGNDGETPADIRALYQETRAESLSTAPPSRRTRAHDVGEAAGETLNDPMSIDDEDDVVQSRLRRAVKPKKDAQAAAAAAAALQTQDQTLMPPPAVPARGRRTKSPSEAPEELEPSTTSSPTKASDPLPTSKPKPAPASSQVTRDEAFLQAIAKSSRSKKAMDELDREFNQLRIPKSVVRGKKSGETVPATAGTGADHPDWGLVDQFEDDLRGNFIQVIRKDLFRKDGGGRREAVHVEDGRPNFKKFKKKDIVRRTPLHLVLTGPALGDADTGEPYWATQVIKTGKGRGGRQHDAMQDDDEEDDQPLLPRSRRRLLQGGSQEAAPSMPTPSLPSSRPSRSAPGRSTGAARSRATRQASVLSSVSSQGTASTTAPPAVGTRKNAGRGARKTEPLFIGDSDDDDDTPESIPAPPAAQKARKTGHSAVSSSGTKSSAKGGNVQAGESTEDVDMGLGATPSGTATVGKTQTTARGRRLLAEDEEGIVRPTKTVQKKRRVA